MIFSSFNFQLLLPAQHRGYARKLSGHDDMLSLHEETLSSSFPR